MKKIMIFIFAMLVILTTGCKKTNEYRKDALKFKQEYEKVAKISKKNPIVYIDLDKAYELMNTKKSVVIYYCNATSDPCADNVELLLEAAKQTSLNKIYYLNNKDVYKIENKQTEKLKKYINLTDDAIIFIKDKDNIGAISNNSKDYKKMNEEEREQYLKILKNSIHETLGDLCDQSC